MRQEAAFWKGEGDAWFRRNELAELNPIVVRELTSLDIKPEKIVEIGCGTGRYLNEMQKKYDCNCWGFDPSEAAITHGKKTYRNLRLYQGGMMAAYNGFRKGSIDVIVFGFCLYLFDRDEIFHTVAWADEMLKFAGYIIIHDFDSPIHEVVPYHHKDGIMSYKMDYPDLWLANPSYKFISQEETQKGEAITIIQKGEW